MITPATQNQMNTQTRTAKTPSLHFIFSCTLMHTASPLTTYFLSLILIYPVFNYYARYRRLDPRLLSMFTLPGITLYPSPALIQ